MPFKKYKHDVSFSFAEEDDAFVRKVADCLKQGTNTVYYYKQELIVSWGKDLERYLGSIYRRESRLCVVFVSAAYKRKIWGQFELTKAQMRAKRYLHEYILPFRLDDTELPQIPSSIKYLATSDVDIQGLANAISLKIDEHRKRDTFLFRLHGELRYYFTSPRHLGAAAAIAVLIGWMTVRDRLTSVDELAVRLYERNTERVEGSLCKDGRFSPSRGSGSCSHHGGVDKRATRQIPQKTMEECREMAQEISWVGE